MKPILYISGPYSANSLIDRQQNILNAKRRFVDALATGDWWAVCPHTHTAEMEMHLPGVDHDEWLRMDIAMLAGCDAIWVYINDRLSPGMKLELAWAKLANMPLFYTWSVKIINKGGDTDTYESIDLSTETGLINDMVSRGEIPDPKTYKGSVLSRGKNESD